MQVLAGVAQQLGRAPEAGLCDRADHSRRLQLLVAGDAAGMCLASGLWLEGVNFAISSGAAAAGAAAEALTAQDLSGRRLESSYRRRLKEGFVLADLERLKLAPHLVLSDRVQHRYPQFVCDIVEEIFTVSNPTPKPRLRSVLFAQRRRAGLRWRDLARDAWTSWRMLG